MVADIEYRWLKSFFDVARITSRLSKDPSLGVGAVIVDHRKRIVSSGFNGLPSGIDFDSVVTTDRDTKLKCTIHAEENAMAFAWRDIRHHFMFCTRHPCARCAAMLVQRGLAAVYWLNNPDDTINPRWAHDFQLARYMLEVAGIRLIEYVPLPGSVGSELEYVTPQEYARLTGGAPVRAARPPI